MSIRCACIIAIGVSLWLPTSDGRAEGPLKPGAPDRIAKLLEWLPENSETLIVAQGPFEISSARGLDAKFVDTARSLACGLPGMVRDAPLAERLKGRKISLAIEASRRFTSPGELGMMPYEGCQILLFDESAHDAVQKAVDECLKEAHSTVELAGTKVAVFEERLERDDWKFFIASPERGLLLCATNQSYLEEVLSRRKEDRPGRAFPDDLTGWRNIDVAAPVWGLRHYGKEFAEADPSSPLRGPAPANAPDDKAIGFTFWIEGDDGKTAKARYLTDAPDFVESVKRRWHHPGEQLAPTVVELSPGVYEITATIDPATHSGPMFVFVAMFYLGHGIYL